MNWSALVPLKAEAERKTRLAARLDPAARTALTMKLLQRLTWALDGVPRIGSITLLSDQAPAGWRYGFIADRSRGLNAELTSAQATLRDDAVVVIHPDLPLVTSDDLEALLDAAEAAGCAIAPDRHGLGTNALAIARGDPEFRFGPGSLERHLRWPAGKPAVVDRPNLALDCDTPDDLDQAFACGFRFVPAR